MAVLSSKRIRFMLVGALGSILLGLPYILRLFGPTEAEVVMWGRVSLWTGVVLSLLTIGLGANNNIIVKMFLSLGYLFLAMLQILPIYLWFWFHGFGISDGSPPSTFVAHWGYALPHVVLLVVSGVVVYYIYRD